MGISARYGTAVYNQSKYGQVFLPASTQLSFSTTGTLIAQGTLSGQIQINFEQLSYLSRSLMSNINLEFNTSSILRQGLIGSSQLEFDTVRAITNAARLNSFSVIQFSTAAEIIFTNIGPYYSTWNGTYYPLSEENGPSIGYLNLLRVETSGNTPTPYIEE